MNAYILKENGDPFLKEVLLKDFQINNHKLFSLKNKCEIWKNEQIIFISEFDGHHYQLP